MRWKKLLDNHVVNTAALSLMPFQAVPVFFVYVFFFLLTSWVSSAIPDNISATPEKNKHVSTINNS